MSVLLACLGGVVLAAAGEELSYARDVLPILADRCFACHGPDRADAVSELRLDDRDSLLRWGVDLEHPETSELLQRIESEGRGRMPPASSKKEALDEGQRAILRRWIEQGAPMERHWAYAPVRKVEPPLHPRFDHPVDRFLAVRRDREGLEHGTRADPRTLIRRLSLDLWGLPPTPEQVADFVSDPDEQNWSETVERLLDSPRHGERMAVFWLDLVRYADSAGYHSDPEVPLAPYRSYVIESFWRNRPFDEFTRQQLAGDLLQEGGEVARIASGYNRLNKTTDEGGAQAGEYLAKSMADRVRTTASVWLGATLGCAECHDHKFDPYSMRDFYRFGAFFADLDERGVYPNNRRPPMSDSPSSLISVPRAPREVRVLARGDWMDRSGELVQPGLPEFLPRLEVEEGGRADRRDLADWLCSSENPLTARVVVNRLWKLLFGKGLSARLDDLGSQGEYPVHPELLDWLAAELVDRGWDLRHVLRLLLSSEAYRAGSRDTPALRERDPQNRLLARQSRWRLDAEFVRDQALWLGGLLNQEVGGPSAKPYQPAGYWSHLNFPRRQYEPSDGALQWRRGVYTHWQRTFLHPSLLAFDAPTREECTAERPRSNTPQAALALLNDPSFVEAARAFAARILRQGGDDDAARLRSAFELATSRPASTEELAVLVGLLDEHRRHYREHPADAEALQAVGRWEAPAELDRRELAAWTGVARALINLHEAITRS